MRRLLVLALVLLPTAALAQWPTTGWNVYCTDAASANMDEADCDDSLPDSPAGLAKAQLEGASEWLASRGFESPRAGHRPGHVYEAWIAEASEIQAADPWGGLGQYEGAWRVLLRREYWDAEPGVRGYGSYLSAQIPFSYEAVHTLFNAVQYRTQPLEVVTSEDHDWIINGTAELATLFWYQAAEGGRFVSPPYFFSDPLHQPRTRGAGYNAYLFWGALNETLASPGAPSFLLDVFQADLSAANGLTGLHEALTPRNSEGLFHYFPEVVARYGTDPALYNEDEGAYTEEEILLSGAPNVARTYTGTVPPVAAHAYDLLVGGTSGEAVGVTVSLEPKGDFLHLIVDGQSYATEDWREGHNEYHDVLEAGERDTLHVRVVNIAQDPASSRERPYELNVRLDTMDPCESNWLSAALNPFNSEVRAEVRALQARWESLKALAPANAGPSTLGRAEYTFNGDGGLACASYFAVSDVEWMHEQDPDPPDPEATLEEIIDRNMPRAVRETGLTEGQIRMIFNGQRPPGVTPADMRRLMEVVQEIAAEPQSTPAELSAVYFHIFEPNLATAMGGIAEERLLNKGSVLTRHRGLGGWRPNSASNLIIYLPGTRASEIEAGRTYTAAAYSLSDDPPAMTIDGPETGGAFYTWWNGDWKSYRCDGERVEDFEGTQETVWGQMTGTVRIESVSPVSVRGSFSLSGSGQQETVEYLVERRDDASCPWEPEVEDELIGISIRAEGTFAAPNFAGIGSFGVAGVGRAVRVGR